MRDLFYEKVILAGKLSNELKAGLGDALTGGKIFGVSTGDHPCIVHVTDDTTGGDETTVANIVAAHDPTPPPDPLVVDLNTAKAQAGANPLDGLTVTQVLAWIDANVTDLASARTALKQMVKIVAIHERRLRIIERALNIQ